MTFLPNNLYTKANIFLKAEAFCKGNVCVSR